MFHSSASFFNSDEIVIQHHHYLLTRDKLLFCYHDVKRRQYISIRSILSSKAVFPIHFLKWSSPNKSHAESLISQHSSVMYTLCHASSTRGSKYFLKISNFLGTLLEVVLLNCMLSANIQTESCSGREELKFQLPP